MRNRKRVGWHRYINGVVISTIVTALFKNLAFGPGAAVATTTALLVLLGCLASLRVFRVQVGQEGS